MRNDNLMENDSNKRKWKRIFNCNEIAQVMLRCLEVTLSTQFGTERQTKDREIIHLYTYAFECVNVFVYVWIVFGCCGSPDKTYIHTKNRIVSTNYIARLVLDVLLCVCVFLCYAITEVSMNKNE